MATCDEIEGEIVQGDRPYWEPLLAAVGEPLIEDFMWMFEVALHDARCLHAYKHIMTRRYLHLDVDGNAFSFVSPNRYRPIAFPRLLRAVLAP